MKFHKAVLVLKPVQNFMPQQMCRFFRENRLIRGIGILFIVSYETMFLGIEMDILYELGKIAIRINLDPSESILKQAAGALIGEVDCFGVTVEKV